MTTTWTIAQSMMSVGVNGTFIPFTNAPDSMQRFVRPALFSTGYEAFELQFSGTALMCRYRGLCLAMTTRHQTGNGSSGPLAERFVVILESGDRKLAVPPKAIYTPRFQEAEFQSFQDLCFFGYEQIGSHPMQTLDLNSVVWSDAPGVTADYSFLIGYPTESQLVKLDEQDESQLSGLTNRWIRQDLESAGRQPMDTENREIFVKHGTSTRRSVEPDGLSGSPVFSIVRDDAKERYLRFDGIVTNAKGDRFAVYPSEMIKKILDEMVEEQKVRQDNMTVA